MYRRNRVREAVPVVQKKESQTRENREMREKVVVGMSGGVDSSVAACLLKEQGYDVIGVTMRMWQEDAADRGGEEAGGCGTEAAEDARRVADTLGIPFRVLDFRADFKRYVVDYFVEEYLRGHTPNPCIACNRYVKWEGLLRSAADLGADYIATGHYARIELLNNGRYTIANSITAQKDQTYALYRLTQEQLARTLLPVGIHSKEEIREIALRYGLPVAHKPDSQEICFIPDDDYVGFIDRQAEGQVPGPGNFVTAEGQVLGRHRGITHYTVGQRRGLELPMGRRVFVTGICPDTNEVVVGENEDVLTESVLCDRVNFMAVPDLPAPRRVLAKIRYNHKGEYCLIEKREDGRVLCTFEKPVRAATPGQAAVFYEDGHVLGGGTIL